MGVVDACFIIDWSKYRRRDRISNLFDIIYIYEEVIVGLHYPTRTYLGSFK